jgi:hypothetical protein
MGPFNNGAFIYQQSSTISGGNTEGITFGNVISINDPYNQILSHEYAHIPQSNLFGALYPIAQAVSMSSAMLLSWSFSGHHSSYNLLECSPTFISVPAPGQCQ